MQKEVIETGKTVELAIESACEKLGCSREDCEWEILDLPKKGFLGIKNIPARVRVSIEVPDEKPARREQRPQPERQPETVRAEPRPEKKAEFKPEPKQEPMEKQVRQEQRPRQEPAVRSQQAPRPRREYQPETSSQRPEPVSENELSEKEIAARDYIDGIIRQMGLSAEYSITHEHGGTSINIVGKGLGVIIGRRGETLDAIQYLTGLASNRGDGDYLRLTVDCGDYRFKRKDTLEALAKKLASQVIKTNVSKTLEPMNPFERRIIHATVSEIEGVSSSSIGEEPNRRVVITSPTARPAPRGGYRDRNDRGFRDGGDRSDRVDRGFRDSNDRGFRNTRGPRRDARPVDGEAVTQERPAETQRPPRDGGERDFRDSGDRGFRGGGDRDRRGGGGDRVPRPATPVQQGPPKQTLEAEVTQGMKLGKIEL